MRNQVSGAHFNPAVSFAVFLVNEKFTASDLACYVATQLVAGFAAAFSYLLVWGATFTVGPIGDYTWVEAVSVEFHYTAFLVFCVLNTALARANAGNEYYGLTIGFTIVAGGYACGKISGGFFNPAIVLANDVVSWKTGVGYSFLYAAFQLLGGAAAAGLYRAVRPEEFGGTAQSLVAKLLSEFLGTYMLVLTYGLNALAASTSDKATAALSIAASLMCAIYALGSVSGGHFNPAVTLAVCIRKKQEWKEGFMYMAKQLFAGALGGISFGLITNHGFKMGPHDNINWGQIVAAEAIFTFVLAYVVLACCTVRNPLNQFFGLAIGFCIIVGGYSAGGLSGGHLNPAVTFGAAIAQAIFESTWFYGLGILLYATAQLGGTRFTFFISTIIFTFLI